MHSRSQRDQAAPVEGHTVQFYAKDDALVATLCQFIQEGLDSGEACVVIATRSYHARVNARLRAGGLDLAAARRRGLYIAMDAARMLSTLMDDAQPNPERFRVSVGRVIRRAGRGGRLVRVFDDMVGQLWLAGNHAAAIQLEALWNDLRENTQPSFSLNCAYPAQALTEGGAQSELAPLMEPYSHLAHADGSTTPIGAGHWLAALSRLERQAHALRVEIAQRQLVEQRLRASEERYRGLFDASPDGIVIIDSETGRIEAANSVARDMLGETTEELVGRELWQVGLFHHQAASRAMLEALRTRPSLRYESLALRTGSGQRQFVEFTASRIEARGSSVIQCTLRDITEREELANRAFERAEELEALQSVTDIALAQPSLDTLLRELLERTRTALNVDNVAILLPDAAERELHIHLARGPEEEVAGQVRVPIGQGVAGTIAATRQLLIVDDLRAVQVANPFLRERLHSLMGMPLLANDHLIGVIHVATERMHRFTEREAHLLRLVAERVALAIERTQLLAATGRARQEALEGAHLLRATFEAIADGVIVFDRTGRLLQMNAAAQRMLGYNGQPGSDWSLADMDRHEVRNNWGQALPIQEWPMSRVLRGEILTGRQTTDITIRSADGLERELSVSGAPMRDATGGVVGGVSVFRDVTAQRRLERRTHEALSALLAMASALVELPEDANQRAGSDDEEMGASPSGEDVDYAVRSPVAYRLTQLARDVLGCQHVEIVAVEPDSNIQIPLPPDLENEWRAERLARPQLYGEGLPPEALKRFAAGESAVIDMTQPPYNARPGSDGATTVLAAPMRVGAQLVGVLALDYGNELHTFTEQERALAEAVAQLAALVFERDRLLHEREDARAAALAAQRTAQRMHVFLGIAGHELRTPVTSIKMGVQLSRQALLNLQNNPLQGDGARALERSLALLQRADEQANRLNRLIEDVLDVTRSQTDRLELHAVPGDFVAVARQAVEGQRLAWPNRVITFETPDSPIEISLDPDRIEQVITNLLTNALKYSAEDQPVAVQVSRTERGARMDVRDHGPGLSGPMQAEIWEPFHQVEGILQQSGSRLGLGLGLYICRTLIERHGGRIGIDSSVGEGSTFWFELPFTPSSLE